MTGIPKKCFQEGLASSSVRVASSRGERYAFHVRQRVFSSGMSGGYVIDEGCTGVLERVSVQTDQTLIDDVAGGAHKTKITGWRLVIHSWT